MKLTLKVAYLQPSGEQVEETITTNIGTICAWEKHTGRRSTDLAHGVGHTDVTFMAWHKLTKSGKESRPYDEWIDHVESIEVPEAEPANPTEAAPSDAS